MTDDNLRTRWGAALRERRRERGLTQGDAARLAGIDQASVSRVERGAGSWHSMTALADALGLTIEVPA